ncbi:MAG: ARPP-1 family domain-containing protein, partial [bacterium]
VQSYALDAIEDMKKEASNVSVDTNIPQLFLNKIATSEIESFSAIGLGEDIRLSDPQLSGAALVNDGGLIHLCVFQKESVVLLLGEIRVCGQLRYVREIVDCTRF